MTIEQAQQVIRDDRAGYVNWALAASEIASSSRSTFETMKISTLSANECKAALAKIISDFGDGYIKEGRYIFDAITRLPPGFIEKKLTTSELIALLKNRYAEVLAIFDPNPQNTPFRLHLLRGLGIDDDIAGVKIVTVDLPSLLANTDCDFYVLAPEGVLLAVACHEDEIRSNERVMWCPVPIGI